MAEEIAVLWDLGDPSLHRPYSMCRLLCLYPKACPMASVGPIIFPPLPMPPLPSLIHFLSFWCITICCTLWFSLSLFSTSQKEKALGCWEDLQGI